MSKSEIQAPKEKTEIQVIADNINTGLQAFEEKKAELTKLKEDASGLTITSIDDKEAIKQVATWRKKLKSERVEIQKQGKSMRDPLTKISKSISEKEYELIDIISPTEKDLQSKEDWVEAEKLKIEEAEKARKQAIIQNRIDKLAEFGFAIDISFLTGLDDEGFDKVLGNARSEFEKEQAKKEEDARLERERQAQIERDLADLKTLREKQAEADRIIKERQEELDRQAEALKKQQEAAERAECKRKQDELDKRTNDRINQIRAIGFELSGRDEWRAANQYDISLSVIETMENEKWDEVITEYRPLIADFKTSQAKKAEEKRLQDIEDAKQQAIADEKERQRIAAAKAEEDRLLAELKKEQNLAISKDKVKYADTLDYLLKTPIHDMRSSQYRSKMKIIRDFIDQFREVEATEA